MPIPKFDSNVLEQICNIIGDTTTGLTGSEIGKLLKELNADDLYPDVTKRKRLYEALKVKQLKDNCGNNVVACIQKVMTPVKYVDNRDLFELRKDKLNKVLSFCGYKIGNDGKLRTTNKATTLTEAQRRAKNLRTKLIERNAHQDVLRFCREELLHENYFHAVVEATKSIAEKIREKTGLDFDDAKLIDRAFNVKDPYLAINTLQTETERSEQKGFINLLKGIFGTFRNTTY